MKVGVLIEIPGRNQDTDDLAAILKSIANSFANAPVEPLKQGDHLYSLKINGVPQPNFQVSVRD